MRPSVTPLPTEHVNYVSAVRESALRNHEVTRLEGLIDAVEGGPTTLTI